MDPARRDHSNHSIEPWLQNFLSHISRLAHTLFPHRPRRRKWVWIGRPQSSQIKNSLYVTVFCPRRTGQCLAAAEVGFRCVKREIHQARALGPFHTPRTNAFFMCEKGRNWFFGDPHEYRPENGRLSRFSLFGKAWISSQWRAPTPSRPALLEHHAFTANRPASSKSMSVSTRRLP